MDGKHCCWRRLRQGFVTACLYWQFVVKQQHMSNNGDPSRGEESSVQNSNQVKVYAPTNSTSNVAACLVVKNETLYLDEWVDFHIGLGFSPLYIYDNSPDHELRHGVHSGIYSWYDTREDIHEHVRLTHWPGEAQQHQTYRHCIMSDAANSTFVSLIDVDEFVVLHNFDNVIDFMDHHCGKDCGQLSLNWRIMGISGEKEYTPVPVTKRNVHWSPWEAKQGTIKVIVRPDYVADEGEGCEWKIDNTLPRCWTHSVMLKKGKWLDTNGKAHAHAAGSWKRMTNNDVPTDKAVLYHYAFKSDGEFYHKACKKSRADVKGTSPMCNNRGYYGNYNGTLFDDAAWKQMTRMVPKYRVYGEAANVITWDVNTTGNDQRWLSILLT